MNRKMQVAALLGATMLARLLGRKKSTKLSS